VVGRWLINLAVRMVENSLGRQKVDPTVLRYVGSIITVTLNVLLVIGILGYKGDRPVCHDDQHAGQRGHDGRQRQDLCRHDPELFVQPLPPRRAEGAARRH
ncbi:hypothetical protein L6C91_13865, partial [Staphylococcus aureus]